MKDIEKLVRGNILSLKPYSTARDEYQGELGVFLDANENPYANGYNRYPDPHQRALKALLSQVKGIASENVFVGNGSDEAIDLVLRIFCEPRLDNAIAIAPSYGMYKVAAQINDVELREVLLGEDFSLPTEQIKAAMDSHTKLIFLCSPNNPTGNAFCHEQLLDLVESVDAMVVVDEAYVDFSEQGSLKYALPDHPNLILLQTMSKAWGLAALRMGLALASERVVELMSEVKYPYNINLATMQIAQEFISKGVAEQVAQIKRERERVAQALAGMKLVEKVYPSQANFLLIKVEDADRIYRHLIGDGIIVRNRNGVVMCEGCLRVTIGTEEENNKLLESMQRYEESLVY